MHRSRAHNEEIRDPAVVFNHLGRDESFAFSTIKGPIMTSIAIREIVRWKRVEVGLRSEGPWGPLIRHGKTRGSAKKFLRGACACWTVKLKIA